MPKLDSVAQIGAVPDSLLATDTAKIASQKIDSIRLASALEHDVFFEAEDSIVLDLRSKNALLFNQGRVKYTGIELDAGQILINWEQSTAKAKGIPDSLMNLSQFPVFKDDGKTYNSREMAYNFKTKKARIDHLATVEGEYHILSDQIKMVNQGVFFMRNGKLTTCNHPDEPHYYLRITKGKQVSGDATYAGPANFVIEGVNLPVVLPFAWFPETGSRSAGILFPEYGRSPEQGFFLRNGGWYQPFGQYLDLAVRADIYSLGSFRLAPTVGYNKRYAFRGNLSVEYSSFRSGDAKANDFNARNDFRITWSHQQDRKANPYNQFTSNVNIASSNFLRNNAFSLAAILQNQLNSSITYSRTFEGKPFNLTAAVTHSQNLLDKSVQVSAPNLAFNVGQFYPLQKLAGGKGKPNPLEKLAISYTFNAQADIRGFDSTFFDQLQRNFLGMANPGMQHVIPIRTSFNLLKYIQVAPNLNYRERWYFKKQNQRLEQDQIVTDTTMGFTAIRDFDANITANTRLFGTFQFKKGRVMALRHTINPSLGLSWRPDFGAPNWGYFKQVLDNDGAIKQTYSVVPGGIYGMPGAGRSGIVNIGIDNFMEVKLRPKNDTAQTQVPQKVRIFDSFSFRTNYNLAVDSFNWSPISVNFRTNIGRALAVLGSANFDPYITNSEGQRLQQTYWDAGKITLGRLQNANLAISGGYNKAAHAQTPPSPNASDQALIERYPDAFIRFDVPFAINYNFNLNYIAPIGNRPANLVRSITVNGDLSLTPNWKIEIATGLDLETRQLTTTSINFYRDLHCWDLAVSLIPFGQRQSYFLTLKVKASSLAQTLRVTRTRSWFDFQGL